MLIAKSTEIIENQNKIILANRISGEWMRMSREVYEVIQEIIKSGEKIEELENSFEEKEDYIFVKNTIQTLEDCGILCESDEEKRLDNKIVSIQMTNRCNLRCKHCCVSAGDKVIEELTTLQMKWALDTVIEWNPLNIMLSGGEPMIRDDFFELLEYLDQRYSGNIILSTNALLINERNVESLVKHCEHFEISIDGVDEESCAIIRGKGVFEKVCSKIKLLKEYGAEHINLSMVFSDKNEHLKERFYELNKQLNTTPVCRIFSPKGRGDENRNIISETSKTDYYIPNDYLVEDYKKAFSIGICSAGKRELFIGCNGNIYPCPNFILDTCILGNILNVESLFDITDKSADQYLCDFIAEVAPINLPRCQKCPVKLFCWTCPGELLDINTEAAFNSRCERLKPILMRRVWEKEINY